jgi:hypothetical protein
LAEKIVTIAINILKSYEENGFVAAQIKGNRWKIVDLTEFPFKKHMILDYT